MSDQRPIDFRPPVGHQFHGEGYVPALDQARLSHHCEVVLEVLRSEPGRWWTYVELAKASGVPEGSVRTRVSNLRQTDFGGHDIEARTREGQRVREVRLTPRGATAQ